MKLRKVCLVGLFTVTLLGAGCATKGSPRTTVEYKCVKLSFGSVTFPSKEDSEAKPRRIAELLPERLNAAAKDGWTVAEAVAGKSGSDSHDSVIVILERTSQR